MFNGVFDVTIIEMYLTSNIKIVVHQCRIDLSVFNIHLNVLRNLQRKDSPLNLIQADYSQDIGIL